MREPTEMEDRVAHAIAEEWIVNRPVSDQWHFLARAAIRAMREPTNEVTTAIMDLMSGRPCAATAHGIWRTLVDTLTPAPDKEG